MYIDVERIAKEVTADEVAEIVAATQEHTDPIGMQVCIKETDS
jgi:hypothetical protein